MINRMKRKLMDESQLRLAERLLGEKRYRPALMLYKRVVGDNTKELPSRRYYEYAFILFKLDEVESAEVQIDKAFSYMKKRPVAYLSLRAEIRLALKRTAEAENDLHRCIEIDGSDPRPHYLLGIAMIRQKLWWQAESSLLNAKNLGYSTAKFYRRLGQASYAMRHYDLATLSYVHAAKRWSNTKTELAGRVGAHGVQAQTKGDMYYMAGISSQLNGDDSSVYEKSYKAAVDLLPIGQTLRGLGYYHERFGNYEMAKEYYLSSLSADRGNPDILFSLGYFYEKSGETKSAIKYYEESLSYDKTSAERHFTLANCYRQLDDMSNAALGYQQAIRRSDKHNILWYVRAVESFKALGNTQEVDNCLQESLVFEGIEDIDPDTQEPEQRIRRARYNACYEKLSVAPGVVMFESMSGNRISCNPFSIFQAMMLDSKFNDYIFVWAINDNNVIPDEYKNIDNVIFITRYTDAYYKYLATAELLVNNATQPPFYIRKKNQKYLNTWHGTPWKTLGFDLKTGRMDYVNTARNFLQASHLIVPNEYTYEHQIVPYQIENINPGEVAISGYPRIDLTFQAMAHPDEIKKQLGIPNDKKKIVLYAPTWRGNKSLKTFDTEHLVDDLVALSKQNVHVLFRGHHLAEALLSKMSVSNVTLVPESFDTNQVMGVVDLLITDYSSVFFDFLVTNKPIIHYVYDFNEYTEERGLYFGLEGLPGDVVTTTEEMIRLVKYYATKKYIPTAAYKEAQSKFVPYDDGQVTRRTIDWVISNKTNDLRVVEKERAKKKLLFYAGGFMQNGITISFINLIKAIDPNMYDVVVTLKDDIGKYPERLALLDRLPDYVKVLPKVSEMNSSGMESYAKYIIETGQNRSHSQYLQAAYDKLYSKEFKRVFGLIQFDIVIDFSGYSTYFRKLLVSASNKNNSIRSVAYLHNDMYSEYTERYPNLAAVLEASKGYDKLVSVSKETSELNKRLLPANFNIPIEKFDYIENVQDPDSITEGSTQQLDTDGDERLFNNTVTTFLTIGRLSAEKDHEKLIRAFARVNREYPDTNLVIVGEGPLKHHLKAVIGELGLDSSVSMLGRRSNPYPYLMRASCFVLSSNYEGQPVVLFEALVLGKPIIATDIVANRSVLERGYGELCENSIDGLELSLVNFINGKLKFKAFDMQKYNKNALKLFDERVLGVKR